MMVEIMSELTDLVKDSSETNLGSSPHDNGTVEEMPEDTILSRQTSINLVPFIGQRFVSQDAAYEFYCSFAKQCGFSIRRHRTRGKDGVGRGVTRRDFTCHRGGFPQMKPSSDDNGKLQRNRKSSRCGCQASMRIVKRADFDVPEWRITCFSNIHNHELLKSNEVNLRPTYCTMSTDDKSKICMYSKAGMSVRQMLRLMELEKSVKVGCLPFTEIDVRNLLQSFRNVDRENDATDLLQMCKVKKDKDPGFSYNFQLDADNRLEHIAWCYASSLRSYEVFGDAVIFDTTHRLEEFDMILGVWIGIDNHGMNCFFGCVLMRDENVQSFSWALKAFLEFTNGKAPDTILTDQNIWLKEAVAIHMPRTKHAFCIWHIVSKFSDWFSPLLGSQYDKWKADFHRVYNTQTLEEFDSGWREMCNMYGLHGNKHIMSLYSLRSFWALPYLRSYFFAGMANPNHSESVNGYIRRVLSAHSALDNFVEQVSLIVESKDEPSPTKQKPQQHKAAVRKVSLKTGSPIESHAIGVLTPYAFSKLQDELVLAPQYASILIDDTYFLVRHHTDTGGGCKVFWAPHEEFINCSCHHFEFSGILCRHVLRVLSTNNCFHIPDRYLPLRWRLKPSRISSSSSSEEDYNGKVQTLHSMVSSFVMESTQSEQRLDVACDQMAMLLSRVKSYPGNDDDVAVGYGSPASEQLILPEVEEDSEGMVHGGYGVGNSSNSHSFKEKRPSLEMCRKRRRCSVPCCGQLGHDLAECPLMQGGGDDDDLGFL